MKPYTYSMIGAVSLMALACTPGPKSSYGFTLPDGDSAVGQDVFVSNSCQSCHTIKGMEGLRDGLTPEMSVELGGQTTRIATYGELVTSVINPSHRLAKGYPAEDISVDGKSRMRNYNDELSVSELIDLVAFLQEQYELVEYEPTQYNPYGYY